MPHHHHDDAGHSHDHAHDSHDHHCTDKNKLNYEEINSRNSTPVSDSQADKTSITFQNETVSITEVKSNKTTKKNFFTYIKSTFINKS